MRAQSAIRADGTPAAQDGPQQFEHVGRHAGMVNEQALRAPRANRVFRTDKNHPS